MALILEQARKYRISMTLAHQYLDQLDSKIRASFAANTSIKIMGGVSDKDAKAFASEMHTSPEMISGMRKFADHAEFAIWVKNVTAGAMRLHVPFGHMEHMPQMTKVEFSQVRDVQRDRYCVPVAEVRAILSEQTSGREPGRANQGGDVRDPFADPYE